MKVILQLADNYFYTDIIFIPVEVNPKTDIMSQDSMISAEK